MLRDQHTCQFANLSVLYLEKVAHIRYGLSVVAETLHGQVTMDEEPIIAPDLMQIAQRICTDRTINVCGQTECTGPSVFLLKLIVRQYGTACLEKITVNHPWVVPDVLHNKDQVHFCVCMMLFMTLDLISFRTKGETLL